MIEIGHAIGPLRIAPVEAGWMRQWADILSDPNEIHLDAERVRRLGLGHDVINQGPINIAYVLNAAMQAFPGAVIERFAARMLGNVYAGDAVTASGRVTAVEPLDNGSRLTCDLTLAVEGRSDAVGIELVLRID